MRFRRLPASTYIYCSESIHMGGRAYVGNRENYLSTASQAWMDLYIPKGVCEQKLTESLDCLPPGEMADESEYQPLTSRAFFANAFLFRLLKSFCRSLDYQLSIYFIYFLHGIWSLIKPFCFLFRGHTQQYSGLFLAAELRDHSCWCLRDRGP